MDCSDTLLAFDPRRDVDQSPADEGEAAAHDEERSNVADVHGPILSGYWTH